MNLSPTSPDPSDAQHQNDEGCHYQKLSTYPQLIFTAKLTLRLIGAIARHRGMSLSILANGQTFAADLSKLQLEINRRIALLKVVSAPLQQEYNINFERIEQAWRTIEEGWQQDTVRENFEYHSHFIELLQSVITRVTEPLNALLETQANPIPQLLLTFCGKTMPQLIELIARIRGLATYLLLSGNRDEQALLRLGHFVKELKKHQYLYQQSIQRLNALPAHKMPALGMIKAYELKLSFVLETVENAVLGDGQSTLSGPQLFQISTEIISVYQQVTLDGLDALQQTAEDSIDKILQNGISTTLE